MNLRKLYENDKNNLTGLIRLLKTQVDISQDRIWEWNTKKFSKYIDVTEDFKPLGFEQKLKIKGWKS